MVGCGLVVSREIPWVTQCGEITIKGKKAGWVVKQIKAPKFSRTIFTGLGSEPYPCQKIFIHYHCLDCFQNYGILTNQQWWGPTFWSRQLSLKCTSWRRYISQCIKNDVTLFYYHLLKDISYVQVPAFSQDFFFFCHFYSTYCKGQIKPKAAWTNKQICFICCKKQKSKQTQICSFIFWENLHRANLLLV